MYTCILTQGKYDSGTMVCGVWKSTIIVSSCDVGVFAGNMQCVGRHVPADGVFIWQLFAGSPNWNCIPWQMDHPSVRTR